MTSSNNSGSTNKSENRTSRRTVLKTIGAGAIFAGGTGIVSGDDNKIEITVAYTKEGRMTRLVSKSWWEDCQHVERVRDTVADTYLNGGGIDSIGVTGSENQIDGHTQMQIRVTYDKDEVDQEEVTDRIPDSKEGVNIVSEGINGGGPTSCPQDSTRDPVPGAIRQGNDKDGTADTSDNTFCAKAYYEPFDEDVIVATAHVYANDGDPCAYTPMGEKSYQYDTDDANREVGEVIQYSGMHDWAAVDFNGRGNLSSTEDIITINGETELSGIWASYQYLIDNQITVHRSALATGHESSYLRAYNVSNNDNCVTYNGEGVEFLMTTAVGDSGAPYYVFSDYDNDTGGVMLVGMQSWGKDVTTKTPDCKNWDPVYNLGRGPSSETLYNYGLDFTK